MFRSINVLAKIRIFTGFGKDQYSAIIFLLSIDFVMNCSVKWFWRNGLFERE